MNNYLKKCLLLVIFILTCLSLTGCGGKTLNAKDYCDIKITGMNGYAKARVSSKYNDLIMVGTELKLDAENDLGFLLAIDEVNYSITSPTENLKNGDKISITLTTNKAALDKYKIKFKNTEFTHVVEGLVEPTVIDPFEGLEVEFNGISPYGQVVYNTVGCDKYVTENVRFTSDFVGYANGDKVMVNASFDSTKAENNAIVIDPVKKEYVVSGLAEYPKSLAGYDLTTINTEYEQKAISELASRKLYKDGLANENVILSTYSTDKWKITDMKITPVDKLYFYPKNAVDSYIKNNYYVLWEVSISAEKTTNDSFRSSDEYKIGDKLELKRYVETYIQSIPFNSDKTPYLDDVSFRTSLHSLDSTRESIIADWKNRNTGDYIIEEIK